MILKLSPYNIEVSRRVRDGFQNHQKICIVRATGTGKSYVALDTILSFSSEKILWLTSQKKIVYQIQANLLSLYDSLRNEGLNEIADMISKNISTMVYRRLISEMKRNPAPENCQNLGLIILDEFHRVGAPCTNKAYKDLLLLNPDAKVLGMSATSYRSREKRDMAQELFHGNIASKIDLYEAIEQSILPLPNYILCQYNEAEELEKLVKSIPPDAKHKPMIRTAVNRARTCLQNAIGLPELFRSTLMYPTGRYMVFCKSIRQLNEMMEKARTDWFRWLQEENQPMIFYEHSQCSPKGKNYQAFCKTKHKGLKLFFSVSMFIEGVHSACDIDGIISLRPTIIRELYEQMNGRCLTCGRPEKTPQIYDIVDNLDLLITRKIAFYYHSISLFPKTVKLNAAFDRAFLIEPSKRELYETMARLRTLIRNKISWEEAFEYAADYYGRYGSLTMKRDTIISGFHLSSWLGIQRNYYRKNDSRLTERRIRLLESIGMDWNAEPEWDSYYEDADHFYQEHGHLKVTHSLCPSESKLPEWIRLQRKRYYGTKEPSLSNEQIRLLNKIGMIWKPNDDYYSWNKHYDQVKKYFETNKHLNMPSTGNMSAERRWLNKQWDSYMSGLLSSDCSRKLESLGFQKDMSLKFLMKYQYYVNHPGKALRWITRQKSLRKLGKLSSTESDHLTLLIDSCHSQTAR